MRFSRHSRWLPERRGCAGRIATFPARVGWPRPPIAGSRAIAARPTERRPALYGRDLGPDTWGTTRALFLRLLGLVFLIAFVSMAVQAKGLFGSHGIAPARELLDRVHVSYGARAFDRFPTLFWLGASDAWIVAVPWIGAALAAALVAGFWPRGLLLVLWFVYLSCCLAGGVFFSFQWDTLLLESALVGALWAPAGVWLRGASSAPSRFGHLAVRLLLVKLMFLSGFVKLRSGDPTWSHLEALTYHYWTQPMPNEGSLLAWGWPRTFQVASAAFALLIELGASFLAFAPRRLRLVGAALLATLQVLIAATGNYGFFNVLALALCVPLLDDRCWRRRGGRGRSEAEPAEREAGPGERYGGRVLSRLRAALLAVWCALSALTVAVSIGLVAPSPGVASRVLGAIDPWRSVNTYGLFARMTTTRPEIIVEASADGASWEVVPFRFKPDGPRDRPMQVAPYMPRLDWQMWFAALGEWRSNPWFIAFLKRLLEGEPTVRGLLPKGALAGGPPRYVRATLYDYAPVVPRVKGVVWSCRRLGAYTPTLTLRDGRLVPLSPGP